MDQFSFEEGLKLGIASARIAVEQDGLQGLREFEAETRRDVARRRNDGIDNGRQMLAGDIFMDVPLAHAADFGLPVHEGENARVAVSRVRAPAPAAATGCVSPVSTGKVSKAAA